MKMILALAALIAAPVSAQCVGGSNIKTCMDGNGNSYTVSRFGNTTSVYGNNAQTGSNWSQQSFRNGNTTQTYGTDAQGRQWNATSTPYATYGTDGDENAFYEPH